MEDDCNKLQKDDKMINNCTFLGRVGRIDLKYLPNGTAICSIALAISEKFTKDNQKQEKTYWANLKAFGKSAEVLQQYVAKGDMLSVVAKYTTNEYQDRAGAKKTSFEFIIDKFALIGNGQRKEQGQQSSKTQEKPRNNTQQQSNSFEGEIPVNEEYAGEDIPF